MSTTIDAIVDRCRSVVLGSPFSYVEAQSPFDFDRTTAGLIDGSIRIVDAGSNRIKAGFGFTETRIDRITVWVARKFNGDPTTGKRLLSRDMSSITTAIVRDGHQVSGEYAIEDEGRQHEIRAEQGAEFAVMQLVLPVNYETLT